MNTLNKDELQIIVNYMDHETMRSLALALLDVNNQRSTIYILTCALDKLIKERNEISLGLRSIAVHLDDIEKLTSRITNGNTADDRDLNDRELNELNNIEN